MFNKNLLPSNSFHRYVLTFILFFVGTTSIKAQEAPSEAQVAQGLALRLMILIIAAIIALITRALLIRRLNKLMLSESKKQLVSSNENVRELEIPAPESLEVKEVYIDSEINNLGPHVKALNKQAKSSINRVFIINLLISVLHVICYTFTYVESGMSMTTSMMTYRLFVYFFLTWTILQFLGGRHQFAAYGKSALGFFKPILKTIFYPFQGFWPRVIGILVLMHTLFFGLLDMNVYLFATVALHLALWFWLRKSGRQQINTKLLILRVFLIGKTSTFTFNNLVKSWRHFGNYFTVADPSFFKVSWKRRFNYMFPFYILTVFFLYTIVTDQNKDDEINLFGGFVFLLIIGNIMMLMFDLIRMKHQFMSSSDALTKRMQKLEKKPTKLDNTFKEVPVMCYDNTWKQAVDGLVNSADVILMDLRGFSEANKGCAYEINILFDKVAVDHIVFMGYENATPLIKNVIQEQWAQLAQSSPNLKLKQPSTYLYVIKKENHNDIDSIVKMLLSATKPN